jgi:nucleotide-binding universal stress UspA family protein
VFERILLPLDGSADWVSLIPHLETISRRGNSEIIVLEAVSFLETLIEMPLELGGRDLGPSGDIYFAERYVAATVDLLRSKGLKVRGLTQIGSEAAAIASVARRQRATLIALAVRERGGFPHTLARTVAEQVLRAAPTPVYAVPARTTEPEAPPPTPEGVVLVPIDGTGLSLQVLPAAAEFCRRFSSRLLLAHIVPRGADESAACRVFEDALERISHEGVQAETYVGRGDPATEILRLCDTTPVTTIAMRTRLATGEVHGPLGSVTVRILRAAQVPMLIVRRPFRSIRVTAARGRQVPGVPKGSR